MVVDGKGVRGVFLLEKEQTTEGMLSKGIIYLEMRELGAPGAQGVYVEASTRKAVGTCYAMLRSLDMSVVQRGSQSRANWCSRKFTLAAQQKITWNHAQNSDDSVGSRW